VPAYYDDGLVNGHAVAFLYAPTSCGSPTSCSGALTAGFANYGLVSPNPCGPWITSVTPTPPSLNYIESGIVDLSSCRNGFFKNVQAKRYWHGSYGYLSASGNSILTAACADMSKFYGPQLSPDRTKYLTQNWQYDYADGSPHGYLHWTANVSVDPNSGVKSGSRNINDGTVGGSAFQSTSAWAAYWTYAEVLDYFLSAPTGYTSVTFSGGTTWTYYTTQTVDGVATQVVAVIITWDGVGNFVRDTYGWIGASADTWGVLYHETAAVTNTDLACSMTSYEPALTNAYGAPGTATSHCWLSNPNPDSTPYNDAISLAKLWDLGDDLLYPFRLDSNYYLAPLVTRNEYQTAQAPTLGGFATPVWNWTTNSYPAQTYVDLNAAIYDGSILGAPLPAGYGWRVAGGEVFYNGIMDFRHANYQQCPAPASDWEINSYGLRTPHELPKNCPQWTADLDVINQTFPPGKCAIFTDAIYVQDWVEVADIWPSYNFARPAGADKFVYDETKPGGGNLVYQVVSGYVHGTGDTITHADFAGNALTAGALAVNYGDVWGGASVGGFYNITKTSDTTVLLGQKVFGLPTGWTSPSGDTAIAFGRLRWPNCPAILGRAAITMSGLTATFATAQPTFGMAPSGMEQVDVYDASMTLLVANATATRQTNSTFLLSTNYPTAAWVMIHGAANWYWDDAMPKGKALVLEFWFDYRAFGSPLTQPFSVYSGFSQTEVCAPFSPCSPRIVPLPDFPSNLALDYPYGSRWQACVVSHVNDPLWQPPHQPPAVFDPLLGETVPVLGWIEDDGTCANDDSTNKIYHYAQAPQVEPRLSLPSAGPSGTETAPALPTGISFGFLSPVNNSSGEVAYAPTGGTPSWAFHKALCDCVAGNGKFAIPYAAFTLFC
jgi:hypothetical protein